MPLFKKTFKELVASIAAGTCKDKHIKMANQGLTDKDIRSFEAALQSEEASEFRQHLLSIDLSNTKSKNSNLFSSLTLKDLPALQALYVGYVGLMALHLTKMPQLSILSAQSNNLTSEMLHLVGLPALQELDLSKNSISSFNPNQFRFLKKLNLQLNCISNLDLSGLKFLEEIDIRHIDPPDPARVNLTRVYVPKISKTLRFHRYNSWNFDPITKQIFDRKALDKRYLDAALNVPIVDFDMEDVKQYLHEMLKSYRTHIAGDDLIDVATVYMLWLVNPDVNKYKEPYKIVPWTDIQHFLIIRDVFIDNVRHRIKEFYMSMAKHWTPEEQAEFNKFATLEVRKLSKETLDRLTTKMPKLNTAIANRIAEFNAGASATITPTAEVAPQKQTKKNTMLVSLARKQLDYMSQLFSKKDSASRRKYRLRD